MCDHDVSKKSKRIRCASCRRSFCSHSKCLTRARMTLSQFQDKAYTRNFQCPQCRPSPLPKLTQLLQVAEEAVEVKMFIPCVCRECPATMGAIYELNDKVEALRFQVSELCNILTSSLPTVSTLPENQEAYNPSTTTACPPSHGDDTRMLSQSIFQSPPAPLPSAAAPLGCI